MRFNGSGTAAPPDHTAILVRMSETIGRVDERTLRIEDRLAHGDRRMDAQDHVMEHQTELLVDTRRRVAAVEDRRFIVRLKRVMGIVRAVAPLKEWLAGAWIVVLSIISIFDPRAAEAILSALTGGR